jgi:D-alanine-D-alanine ligase
MATRNGRRFSRPHAGGSVVKAAIAYDGHADGWSPQDVQQVLDVVGDVAESLSGMSYETVRVPVRPGVSWLEDCMEADIIFNLCEGLGGVSRFESQIAGALELTGVPVTGASARTIILCHNKPLVNALLASRHLPVPLWTTPEHGSLDTFPFPAIVKPAAEDASVGIDQQSVVTTRAALDERVSAVAHEYGEVMIQQYVHGREIAVGFLGTDVLPISEIDFSRMPEGAWPILSFDAKWLADSAEDRGSQPICPASLSPTLAGELTTVAQHAWNAVGGSGYGRVDLRVDDEGYPWIIEVNPNPDVSTDAGLARMARVAGYSYADLVGRIVEITRDLQAARPSGTLTAPIESSP